MFIILNDVQTIMTRMISNRSTGECSSPQLVWAVLVQGSMNLLEPESHFMSSESYEGLHSPGITHFSLQLCILINNSHACEDTDHSNYQQCPNQVGSDYLKLCYFYNRPAGDSGSLGLVGDPW